MESKGRAPQKFLTSTPMPVEIALNNYDEAVHLLVSLGAEVNLPTKESVRYGGDDRENHFTCLDYAHTLLSKLEEGILATTAARTVLTASPDSSAIVLPTSADPSTPTWKTELLQIAKQAEKVQRATNKSHVRNNCSEAFLEEIKAYLDGVVELLTSNGGKSGAEVFGAKVENNVRLQRLKKRMHKYYAPNYGSYSYGLKQPFDFHRHGGNEGSGMRLELADRYAELYAACWSGNNAKIQRLCLPSKGQKVTETPLQISVHWGNRYSGE
jgi:hypothetical protein